MIFIRLSLKENLFCLLWQGSLSLDKPLNCHNFKRDYHFGPGLGLPSKDHSCYTKNQLLPKPFTEKTSKSAKYRLSLRYKKDPLR